MAGLIEKEGRTKVFYCRFLFCFNSFLASAHFSFIFLQVENDLAVGLVEKEAKTLAGKY